MNILVSVIIPTHNPTAFLQEAVSSVLKQDGLSPEQVEILIIDDASTNKSGLALLQELKNDSSVQLIRMNQNLGPSAARNIGVKAATGRFIGFLDDDDLWPSDKWHTQKSVFDEDTELELVTGQIQYFQQGTAKMPTMNYHVDEDKLYHVHLGACLVRDSYFESPDALFDETLRLNEDWDWWLKVKEGGIAHTILDRPTLLYRVHDNNTSTHLDFRELGLLKVLKSSLDRRRASGQTQILSPHQGAENGYQVSVMVPLYNGEKYITRALDSVLSQTYPINEIIVVDDGSTDKGADLVSERYPQVTLVRQANRGVSAARNNGWKRCSSTWLAFLDQDDEWTQDKIEKQINEAKKNRKYDWIFCHQRFVSPYGTLPDFFKPEIREDHESFAPSSWLIRKNTLESLNGFNETLRYAGDAEILKKYRENNQQEARSQETLLFKHVTGENESLAVKSMTRELLGMLHKNIKRDSNDQNGD